MHVVVRIDKVQVGSGDPSRFLEEIDEGCIVHPQQAPSSRSPVDFAQARSQFQRMPSGTAPRSFGRLASKANPTPSKPTKPGSWSSLKEAAKSGSAGASEASPASSPAAGSDANIAVGDIVVHAKFGKGRVLHIEGSAPNEKATITFPAVGKKQLLLKFAKLQVVG